MAEIVLEKVTKRFGRLVAVDNLDLDIKDKEFLVLLGPSGCGKTTTLRCISGLEIPDEGRILINNKDVTVLRASKRDIAFVFQLYALYPLLTVRDNIAFPLKTQRHDRKTIEREVNRVVDILQIRHILDKKPKHLSGGDMQRVALARAMVRRPQAFLLDEPIGTLDAKFREEMRTELKRLHVDIGATTVYVTHDQAEAMAMGDRIAVMKDGLLQQLGTPHQVYAKPRNLFVANFIGSPGMNFIPCEPGRDSDGKLCLKMDGLSVRPGPETQRELSGSGAEKTKLVLGVRPEDVTFSATKKDGYLPGKVYVVEEMGSYNIIDVQLGGETIKVRTPPTVRPEVGAPAFVRFDLQRISLFDRETGSLMI